MKWSLLENPVRFGKCRLEPVGIAVVLDRTILTVAIANQIGWIGQDEIDAARWQTAHNLDAIAAEDCVV
jgi:hypothetical protein